MISADGGAPSRLTNHPSDDVLPYWSRHGPWMYFASNRTGTYQIFRVREGGGDPVLLTKNGGWCPVESPDGKWLYYQRRMNARFFIGTTGTSPVFAMRTDGGNEVQVIDAVADRSWTVTPDGIYYVPKGARTRAPELRFFDASTRKTQTAGTLAKPLNTGIAASADGRSLLVNQVDHTNTEIILVENFR